MLHHIPVDYLYIVEHLARLHEAEPELDYIPVEKTKERGLGYAEFHIVNKHADTLIVTMREHAEGWVESFKLTPAGWQVAYWNRALHIDLWRKPEMTKEVKNRLFILNQSQALLNIELGVDSEAAKAFAAARVKIAQGYGRCADCYAEAPDGLCDRCSDVRYDAYVESLPDGSEYDREDM